MSISFQRIGSSEHINSFSPYLFNYSFSSLLNHLMTLKSLKTLISLKTF